MDFRHSDDRQMLADMLGRYLRDNCTIEARHAIDASDDGWSATHWRQLCELGVTGALFGEAAGGFGGGAFDIAVIFEQLGRALVVEPFLATLVAGRLLERTGAAPELLADAIAGTRIITLAHDEVGGGHAATASATPDGDGWRLSGEKTAVPHAAAADEMIVSARIDGDLALFRVARDAPGVTVLGYRLIDGGRAADVTFDVAPAALISVHASAHLDDAIAAGILALSWEAVGALDVLRDSTIEYLRTRRQFGVPIGSFQALQHRIATLALEIEQTRSAAINAAAALAADSLARDRAASAAKYTVGHIGRLAAEEAIQMHGGIGMTWELPLAHYAKRLAMIDHQLGDQDHHLARFAQLGQAA